MISEIIIHNSISTDGSLTGFMPDMKLHYKIAGQYKPDAHLIGSETILAGIELFGEGVPDEVPEDFFLPMRNSDLPRWVIVDSLGKLKGMLHTCRRFEYCSEVMIIVSKTTPVDYITHLVERNYKFIVAGEKKVDLKEAVEKLREEEGIGKILTDTGSILSNLLLNLKLATEISLLVHPLLIGEKGYFMFSHLNRKLNLNLIKSEQFDNGCIWNIYNVKESDSNKT